MDALMEIQEMLLHECKLLLNLNAVCLQNHVPWSYEGLKAVNADREAGVLQGGIFMNNSRWHVCSFPCKSCLPAAVAGKEVISKGVGATPARTVRLALFVYPTPSLFVCPCSLVSVIRGQVLTGDGTPLIGVNVSFLHYPEYGYTITRQDGM